MTIEDIIVEREKLHGRRMIYIEPKDYEDIQDVLGNIECVFRANAAEVLYLNKYASGDQPVYQRVKTIRPEINNKPVENHALEILNFKTGYMFGEPVQYVLRGTCNQHDPEAQGDERVAKLNELMQLDDKSANDKRLGEDIMTCGVGYRMVLPPESGSDKYFETYTLEPHRTWVALSDDYKKEPLLCGYYSRKYTSQTVYSKKYVWTVKDGKVQSREPNPMGMLPIIMYTSGKKAMGCFEVVLDLCDALNNISANRLDSVEQFVQSFIWFHNCDIDSEGFKELKEKGGIVTKSPNGASQALIKILSEAIDQTQVQTLTDDIYQKMLTIAGVPDRRASAGGNTGQALIIGEGWIMAESSARDFELEFTKPEKQYLRCILHILQNLSNVPDNVGSLSVADIDIKFTRNKTDNLLVKTQALANMLNAGVHPRLAFKICGLFNDPEQAYQDSIPYLDAIRSGDMSSVINKADNTDPVGQQLLEIMDKLNETSIS